MTTYDNAPPPWIETAQKRAVQRAEHWLKVQGLRLAMRPEHIREAIRARAWLPSEIETLSVAEASLLAGSPSQIVAAQFRAASVMPIRLPRRALARHVERVNRMAKRAA